MWSPTTTASEKNNTTTSDNKKKEEVEDCRCSSADVDAASSVGQHPKQQQQQQTQQLNTFNNNSKKSKSTFGGNLAATNKNHNRPTGTTEPATTTTTSANNDKTIEKEFGGGETIDSGFISGPQSSQIYHEDCDIDVDDHDKVIHDEKTEGAIGAGGGGSGGGGGVGGGSGAQNFNIPGSKTEEENVVLDSGIVEVEEEEFAENDYSEETTTNDKQRVQIEQSNAAFANDNKSKVPIMIFKENVEADMSEWICNLSLQTNANPSSTSQQQQQTTTTGASMNNLNAGVERKTVTNEISSNQNLNNNRRQPQQQQQGTATGTTTTINITPSNAWEQFYQQNDDGDTPLHLACISGYVDVVAALIRMAPHPCLFNIQNDEAQTPLHLAALTAQPNLLRMLLLAGAEPTIRDRHGNTALHLVCLSGEKQCVRALTENFGASEIHEAHRQYGHRSNDKAVSSLSYARLPADLEIRNYDGERCVHLAAQAGHIDILRILVSHGADINAREGKSGRTPLHIAIECCNEDLANFLLDECEKLNLETATYAGLTAYQVACILNKSQMQNILEKRGAEPLTPPDSDYDSSDMDDIDLDDSKIYDRFGDPKYFVSYNGGNPMTVA